MAMTTQLAAITVSVDLTRGRVAVETGTFCGKTLRPRLLLTLETLADTLRRR